MRRILLKSKLHRATITETNLHYEGSITIDGALLDQADILEHEQVQVYDINNGARLTTYAIRGTPGSGMICMNGAGARLVQAGDLVIICTFAEYGPDELHNHRPRVLILDTANRVGS